LAATTWADAAAAGGVSCPAEPTEVTVRAACGLLRSKALERWDTGDLEGAVRALRLAFDLFPDPRFSFNIAQLERQRGRCDEARAEYQRYLELDPEGAWAKEASAHLEELASCEPSQRQLLPDDPLLLSPTWLPAPLPARLAPTEVASAAGESHTDWRRVLPPALGAAALLSAVAGTLFYFEADAALQDAHQASGNYTAKDERRRREGEVALQRARGLGLSAAALGLSALGSYLLWAHEEPTVGVAGPFVDVTTHTLSAGWQGRF
jgi:hypothetical protein